jgi:hypothetical protein
MSILGFIFRAILLGIVTRLLGAFAPLLRRLLRLIWR